jgi:molybdate transport system ATP-binding protein
MAANTRDARYIEARLRGVRLERQGRLVLDSVTWTIRPGEKWVLVGANGAGKTQLLKLIAGSVWPNPGGGTRQYHWRGRLWRAPYEVAESIGYLGPERQDRYTRYGWNPTVSQVVATGVHRTDIPLEAVSASERRAVAAMLRRLRIEPLAERRFLSLSYGERRLTLLARALASRPRLLLLDELLNGLDETHHRLALRWLESTGRSRLPWVLATHRLEDVPACATHALALERGRVVYRGRLAGAPLGRWLRAPAAAEAAGAAARAAGRRSADEVLVRLCSADVHLEERLALRNVSIVIRRGECWVVHGHNGAGKTTLLRTLYGDHGVASGGRIERAGIESGVPLQQFKRRVGMVAPHLQADHPPDMTVEEAVQSGRHASIGLNEPPSAADRAAAARALRQMRLSSLGRRTLRELSYGQLRRMLFARALARKPALLLLDEPFSGVDQSTRLQLLARLEHWVAAGIAVVMTAHRRSDWPRCSTHELELAGGRVRYAGRARPSGKADRAS